MMKTNAIRKQKRFLAKKKSVKKFFQKKTNKRENISDDETQENVDENQENPSHKNKSILTDV